MRNLKLQKLYLLSRLEGKARTETFDTDVTVVFGANETGKSVLLKSIYATFGADPQVVNPKWQQASVATLLEFSIDDDHYTIVREGNQIGLFDDEGAMLWTGTSLTKEVGPKIAELLDFKIQLATRNGDLITPPTQFAFLPFYQDQDRGWNDKWESFKGLAMLSGYRASILEYHTGIKPKEYYVAQADKAVAVQNQNELKAERRALDRASERLQADRPALSVTFNPELFANQIDQLLGELNELRAVYDGVRKKLSELQSRRAVLVEEIQIAGAALGELDADFKFLQGIDETEVICPILSMKTVSRTDLA
jgi:DNA repair exonuclease SbcCD ATPase subunit